MQDHYARPNGAAQTLVWLGETSRKMMVGTRDPLPVTAKRPVNDASEHVRGDVAQLFVGTDPLSGWSHVTVTVRWTRRDFTIAKALVDEHSANAVRIVLVINHMNQVKIHGTASQYAAASPAEARRLAAEREKRHSPRHGSWLKLIELELSGVGQ